MGRKAYAEPQWLYKGALYLVPYVYTQVTLTSRKLKQCQLTVSSGLWLLCSLQLKCVVAASSVNSFKFTDRPNVNAPVRYTKYNLEQIPVVLNFKILTAVCETDRLWGPPSLLYGEYRGWSGRGWNLTTHVRLV
jgi:hypothetical protein